MSRYDRQERIENWKQNSLSKGKVAIVGAGALGNYVAPILVAYGIGKISIYDPDTIEVHNLARQIMFTEDDAINGEKKVDVIVRELRKRNSDIEINGYDERITEDNIGFLFMGSNKPDVIVDCVDNNDTREILNKFAIENDIPMVHMGTSYKGGEICVITRETPCLNCFTNFEITRGDNQSCRDVITPSIAETNAVIGSLGAGQVRMLIMKKYSCQLPFDQILQPILYYTIGRKGNPFEYMIQKKKSNCPICGKF